MVKVIVLCLSVMFVLPVFGQMSIEQIKETVKDVSNRTTATRIEVQCLRESRTILQKKLSRKAMDPSIVSDQITELRKQENDIIAQLKTLRKKIQEAALETPALKEQQVVIDSYTERIDTLQDVLDLCDKKNNPKEK